MSEKKLLFVSMGTDAVENRFHFIIFHISVARIYIWNLIHISQTIKRAYVYMCMHIWVCEVGVGYMYHFQGYSRTCCTNIFHICIYNFYLLLFLNNFSTQKKTSKANEWVSGLKLTNIKEKRSYEIVISFSFIRHS